MNRGTNVATGLSRVGNGWAIAAARPSDSLSEAAAAIAGCTPRRPYQVTGFGSSASQLVGSDVLGSDVLGSGDSEVRKVHGESGSGSSEDLRPRQMRTEAVLLLAKTPLSARKLAQLAHLADATEARTLVRQLNQIYDDFGRAIRVEQVAGGYRMLTRPVLAPWLARLGHLPPPIRLSTPMMETLAVVAYRQPVSRASAEAVRGVACGELLRQLMERDLVRIVGRSEELGRPYLYGTTKRFLQLFGLPNTDALPPIQWQALQEDPIEEDSPLDDLSTSTKEPVVSTSVAPVLTETDPSVHDLVAALAPPDDASVDARPAQAAIDDDEEEEFFDDDEEEEDDDWEDEDDWDDEDDLDEDDLDEDDLEEDELEDEEDDEDAWEEVDDEDEDEDEDLDDDEEWDDEDDEEEDWDDDEEDEDEDEDEEWD